MYMLPDALSPVRHSLAQRHEFDHPVLPGVLVFEGQREFWILGIIDTPELLLRRIEHEVAAVELIAENPVIHATYEVHNAHAAERISSSFRFRVLAHPDSRGFESVNLRA